MARKSMTLTEKNLKIIKLVLTGKYLKKSFSKETRDELGRLGYTNVYQVLEKLEKAGVIVGYVPIISEEGRKFIESMENIYDLKNGNKKSALMEVFDSD